MRNRRKRRSGRGALVKAYAEGIASSVLARFPKEFKRVVGKKSGIYILTKGKKIYYVGIASRFASRLPWHLKDRHRRQWEAFSLYSIGRQRYLRDIESILIRVARPKGNRVRGHFGQKAKLNRKLVRQILRTATEEVMGTKR